MNTGQHLYRQAKQRIPGGTQLLSKRPEQFLPEQWPAYYSRAAGCAVWDLDGRQFLDFTSCGVGSCLLGYADPDVNAAVSEAITNGNMCMLNPAEEVHLADRLCALHPWAEKARFARCGGEAMAIAVRIARAFKGRATVAFCGYHGWSDWYLAANLTNPDALQGHLLPGLSPAGVPANLRGTAVPFHYNQIRELEEIVTRHGKDLAAIVMEPMRHDPPRDDFLDRVRSIADETDAVLIFDEITSGWRSNYGGIHLKLGVSPDLAVFAKAMSNGFPMSAIIGRSNIMSAAEESFISSTYWTERIGPVAAMATIEKMGRVDVAAYVERVGNTVRDGWRAAGQAQGISVKVGGIPALNTFEFDYGSENQAAMTLFTQEMLDRGFLANGSYYPTLAHRPLDVAKYLAAVNEVFARIRVLHDRAEIVRALRGPIAHSGFARLT